MTVFTRVDEDPRFDGTDKLAPEEKPENPFKPGDIVHLKSGSVRWTVGQVEGNDCYCYWVEYNTQQFNAAVVPWPALEPHGNNSRQ